MKKAIAWSISWILFWLGHWISYPMIWNDWLGRLYPVYNALMCWSSSIQEWGDVNGPWDPYQK